MILVYTVLIGLASYRLWRLVAIDTITEPVRSRLPDREWLWNLIECGYCLGSWIAFALTWGVDVVAGLRLPVLVGLAAAVVVGWLSEHL